MKCDKCGRKVESRREEIEHLLEQHDDKITSHEKDELKRELNQMDTGGVTDSLPLRKLGIAAAVIAVLAGGGYGLLQTGIVTFSTDASPTGSFAVGAAGSAHDHAQFTVTVNGEEVVPAPNLQGLDSRAHFEGDGVIHAHATGVTPGYVFSTFEDALGSKWNISKDSVTIAGDRYVDGRGANISITANGQPVDNPRDYVLNRARSFSITVEGEPVKRSTSQQKATIVRMSGQSYIPSQIDVGRGDRIRFVNTDSYPHTVTVPELGINKQVSGGETVTITVDTTGTFDLVCTIHQPQMDGSIKVSG